MNRKSHNTHSVIQARTSQRPHFYLMKMLYFNLRIPIKLRATAVCVIGYVHPFIGVGCRTSILHYHKQYRTNTRGALKQVLISRHGLQ